MRSYTHSIPLRRGRCDDDGDVDSQWFPLHGLPLGRKAGGESVGDVGNQRSP